MPKDMMPPPARPLPGVPAARTSRQLAGDLTRQVERGEAATTIERIKVVAIKRGYDGRVLREEGERFTLALRTGAKFPSWVLREAAYLEQQAKLVAAADDDDDDDAGE